MKLNRRVVTNLEEIYKFKDMGLAQPDEEVDYKVMIINPDAIDTLEVIDDDTVEVKIQSGETYILQYNEEFIDKYSEFIYRKLIGN